MIWDTCSALWANEDRRYKGPHTCHLVRDHASAEHECACGARSEVALAEQQLLTN